MNEIITAAKASTLEEVAIQNATDDKSGTTAVDQALDTLIQQINNDPRFKFINTEEATASAPDDDELADQDLADFAQKVENAIMSAAGSTAPADKKCELATTAIYTFLEYLTNNGIDITIEGRSITQNIGEVGDAGLQYVYSYVQVCQEEDE